MTTAIADAYMRAFRVDHNEARFSVDLARYLNNGGTVERARALLADAAERMEGAGHYGSADKAICGASVAFQPDDDEAGHCLAASVAKPAVPASSSPVATKGLRLHAAKAMPTAPDVASSRNGAGHGSSADKASLFSPSPVSPAYIAAARRGAQTIARSVLDSFKVRDGRAIGDLAFCEIEGLRGANVREAAVLRQIQKHAANVDPSVLVRDVIKAADLERMIQRAAEASDAS